MNMNKKNGKNFKREGRNLLALKNYKFKFKWYTIAFIVKIHLKNFIKTGTNDSP